MVKEFQDEMYGTQTLEDFADSLEEDKLKEHFTSTTSLISDDPKLIYKELRDLNDVQIFTDMFVGSKKNKFEVIFDTGSNWFWVQSNACNNCNGE